MNSVPTLSQRWYLLAGSVFIVAVVAAAARAAVTPSIDVGENFPSMADFQTFDPHDPATPTAAERTVHTTRHLTQTFQLAAPVSVEEIDLLYARGMSGNSAHLQVFDVADTLAGDITDDYNLAMSNGFRLDFSFNMPTTDNDNIERMLRLNLSGADRVTLPGTSGSAGYALSLSSTDNVSEVFTWRFGDPGTGGGVGWYADGRVYYDDFISSGNTETRRDGLFALQGPLATLQLKVDPLDGDVALTNPTENPISLNSYRIASAASLDDAQWNPVSSQSISGFPHGDGTGNGWEVGPNVGPSELVEWYLQGDSMLAAGSSIYLGHAYDKSVDGRDLQFHYGSGNVDVVGAVEYAPFEPTSSMVPGDYNGNGVVDAADYTVWRDHLGQTYQLTNEDPNNMDGQVTSADYAFWKAHFGETAAGGGALTQHAVPEPVTVCLLLFAVLAILSRRFATAC
jgi:Dockerin type I domain